MISTKVLKACFLISCCKVYYLFACPLKNYTYWYCNCIIEFPFITFVVVFYANVVIQLNDVNRALKTEVMNLINNYDIFFSSGNNETAAN